MSIFKFIVVTFLLLLLLAGAFLAYHMHSKVPVTTVEVYRDDEAEQAQRAADNFVNVIKETTGSYAARGAHAKAHACVRAFFEVDSGIPDTLQHGVFKLPGAVYKSWIRFSNGASNLARSQDFRKDSRGMAIKLFRLNQYGNDIVEAGDPLVQDFLMHNNPVFFSANIEDYNRLVESENKILSFFDSVNPFKWRLRELTHVIDTLAVPPYSPLWASYFSNTAYRLGPHNIKFSARACTAGPAEANPLREDADFLRLTMAQELAQEEACFQFMIQLQDPAAYMPIEDPSIEWKAEDSPYMRVASIRIPVQDFDSPAQQQFCEDLSFSPWHALAAHRPVGQLNRIRKLVYAASSRYRHATNASREPENLEW